MLETGESIDLIDISFFYGLKWFFQFESTSQVLDLKESFSKKNQFKLLCIILCPEKSTTRYLQNLFLDESFVVQMQPFIKLGIHSVYYYPESVLPL